MGGPFIINRAFGRASWQPGRRLLSAEEVFQLRAMLAARTYAILVNKGQGKMAFF